jgi:hypothetical protein
VSQKWKAKALKHTLENGMEAALFEKGKWLLEKPALTAAESPRALRMQQELLAQEDAERECARRRRCFSTKIGRMTRVAPQRQPRPVCAAVEAHLQRRYLHVCTLLERH